MAFTRPTDDQERLLKTLVDLRTAGTLPTDSFTVGATIDGNIWLYGPQPRQRLEGTLAALDALASLGYLHRSSHANSRWQGSLTRMGMDYVRGPERHAAVRFDDLDETQFEEFCFALLRELGFVNLDWRKGTGLASSPADRGRDIVGQLEQTDIDRTRHVQTWFVECKHYIKGVPPERLQTLLTWAQAERPDTALVIASNFLSNPAKDYLKNYEDNNRPPFRIKYWERPILERLTEGKDELLRRYLVTDSMRPESELLAAQEEYFDKLWYHRHMLSVTRQREEGQEPPAFQLEAGARVRARIEKYPDYEWPMSDFDLGMINGKLSALRWVLGDEWDFLDT